VRDAGTVGEYAEAEAMFKASIAAQMKMEDGKVKYRC
jgi:hypothetical protein